jgi:cycloartenol synthase
MWLLPYWLPFHPGNKNPNTQIENLTGRFWCHCRMVYLPMSYLFGKRAVATETPLLGEVRKVKF